jgi:NADPH:quinone reductase-like Zn-dependent oxidoreductase
MKAVVYTQYGSPDVLHLAEVAKPTPKDNEILIRVYATSIGFGDIMARQFNTITPRKFNMPALFWLLARIEFGFRKPKKNILGSEFAGEVEAVGAAVTRFKVGDPVFGYPGPNFGANAEYLCMAETATVAIKPSNLTYEEAAAVPYGALTALNLLKKANIQRGQKVLINGASGGIGSAAVQLAKHLFGADVTGVCSTANLALAKALGADHVIDYTQEDFTQRGETYDVIFDAVAKIAPSRGKKALKPNGIYLNVHKDSRADSGDHIRIEELLYLKELIEAGKLKPVIDRCYPLEQIVEAHRYVDAGHKKGNVVIIMGADPAPRQTHTREELS